MRTIARFQQEISQDFSKISLKFPWRVNPSQTALQFSETGSSENDTLCRCYCALAFGLCVCHEVGNLVGAVNKTKSHSLQFTVLTLGMANSVAR